MTGHVVHLPDPQHHCYPPDNDESRTITFNSFNGETIETHPWMPDGAVWECECGKRWRATYPYVNLFAPTWVRIRAPRRRKPRRSLLAMLGIGQRPARDLLDG